MTAISKKLPPWIGAWVATIDWAEPKDRIAAKIKAAKYKERLRTLLATDAVAKELATLYDDLKKRMAEENARTQILWFLHKACLWAKLAEYHAPLPRHELLAEWASLADECEKLSKALRDSSPRLPLIDITPLIQLPGLRAEPPTMDEYLAQEDAPLARLLARYASELRKAAEAGGKGPKKRIAGPDASRAYLVDALVDEALQLFGDVPAPLIAAMLSNLGVPVDVSTVRKRGRK